MITCTQTHPCGNEMLGILGLVAIALFVAIMALEAVIRWKNG